MKPLRTSPCLTLKPNSSNTPIESMYAIYGNIYHQYTPNVSIYTIHGSYGTGALWNSCSGAVQMLAPGSGLQLGALGSWEEFGLYDPVRANKNCISTCTIYYHIAHYIDRWDEMKWDEMRWDQIDRYVWCMTDWYTYHIIVSYATYILIIWLDSKHMNSYMVPHQLRGAQRERASI